jgi:hypothetical protein
LASDTGESSVAGGSGGGVSPQSEAGGASGSARMIASFCSRHFFSSSAISDSRII